MHFKKYPKYKDSGVDWLGKIPEEWEVKNIMYQYRLQNGYAFKTDDFVNEGVPIVKMNNLKSGKLSFKNASYLPKELCMKEFEVKSDDLLIGLSGSVENFAEAREEDLPCQLNQRIGRFIILGLNSKNYLKYFLQSQVYQKQIYLMSNGSTIMNVSTQDIEHLKMPVPIPSVQKVIVNFLDQKTTKIDKLIRKNKKLIKLLEEKRQALITQAVTKGLDPDVKMKESGVRWIGEIPKHWELKRLRYTGSCQNGISKSADYFGHGFPFVSYSDVYRNHVLPRQVEELAASSEKDRDNYSVKKGDVFFTRTSETAEEIGLASTCIEGKKDAVFAGFLIRFRPNKGLLFDGFSKYYFRSQLQRVFFVKEMNLVTRASLSQELLKKMPIILPSMQEQSSIASYLDRETAKIDKLKANTKRQNILLKEYRQALISSVVTGKIKI